jgi:hypothetical protein
MHQIAWPHAQLVWTKLGRIGPLWRPPLDTPFVPRTVILTRLLAVSLPLLATSLPTPNKDQLNSTLDSLKGAKANADAKAKAITSPNQESATLSGRDSLADADAKRQFSTAVLTYKATIATCLIEHPQ